MQGEGEGQRAGWVVVVGREAGWAGQLEVLGPGAVVEGQGLGGEGHVWTRSASFASFDSPMPSTSRSWSTDANGPLRVRWSTMR